MAETELEPALYDAVIEALKDVIDPEIGVNIVDLGLIYGLLGELEKLGRLLGDAHDAHAAIGDAGRERGVDLRAQFALRTRNRIAVGIGPGVAEQGVEPVEHRVEALAGGAVGTVDRRAGRLGRQPHAEVAGDRVEAAGVDDTGAAAHRFFVVGVDHPLHPLRLAGQITLAQREHQGKGAVDQQQHGRRGQTEAASAVPRVCLEEPRVGCRLDSREGPIPGGTLNQSGLQGKSLGAQYAPPLIAIR